MTEIIDFLKKFTDGKQNTEKLEISVLQFNRIIKALEQEPCDDAISRQEVIDTIDKWVKNMHVLTVLSANDVTPLFESVHELSSITSQPKMGRWITWKEANNIIPSETRFECSVCHDAAYTLCNGLDLLSPYCPNCGAKMSEITTGAEGSEE